MKKGTSVKKGYKKLKSHVRKSMRKYKRKSLKNVTKGKKPYNKKGKKSLKKRTRKFLMKGGKSLPLSMTPVINKISHEVSSIKNVISDNPVAVPNNYEQPVDPSVSKQFLQTHAISDELLGANLKDVFNGVY